ALLVVGIERRPLAVGKGEALTCRHLAWRKPPILPAVDQRSQLTGWPAIAIHATRLDDLLHETELVIRVEDREAALQAHQLRVGAQNPGADRVERAEPGHAFNGAADELPDALLHLARRLVGEGDGEDLARSCAA